jgi:molybdenum cofactor cytidylyltransferase
MGSPKALLDYGGEAFLDRLIGLVAGVCGSVTVVLGYHAAVIHSGIRRVAEAVFVLNQDPSRGQLSSLQCGLRAIPAMATHALFLPVDLPAVTKKTMQAVASRKGDAPLVIPRCEDKHGHPVLASRTIIAELIALPLSASAREVIHKHLPEARFVDTADSGILHDVDSPEAYRLLLAGELQC